MAAVGTPSPSCSSRTSEPQLPLQPVIATSVYCVCVLAVKSAQAAMMVAGVTTEQSTVPYVNCAEPGAGQGGGQRKTEPG